MTKTKATNTGRVGPLIRAARLARGLTVGEVASKLGVRSPHYISMVESGRSSLGANRLYQIAAILGVVGAERDRWMAAADHIPADLWQALVRAPDRWEAVRAALRQRPAGARSRAKPKVKAKPVRRAATRR